jgi:hypothetical protein
MRYKVKSVAALDIVLGSLPNQMRVEVEPGQPICASSMTHLLRRTFAPDCDCPTRFRCTAAAFTIYPLGQLDRSPTG